MPGPEEKKNNQQPPQSPPALPPQQPAEHQPGTALPVIPRTYSELSQGPGQVPIPIGRPPGSTEEDFEQVLEEYSEDPGISLQTLCDKHEIRWTTFWKKLNESQHFRDALKSARKVKADILIEEILSIADDATKDERFGGPGKSLIITDHEHITRSKLRCEMRLRIAAKFFPKMYGEHSVQRMHHSGKIKHEPVLHDPQQMSDDDIDRELEQMEE